MSDRPLPVSVIYDVAQKAGVYVVRAIHGADIPIRNGSGPVESFDPGWTPKFVFGGFSPILLLELVHENGMPATWFLNGDMSRIGGTVQELTPEVQTFLTEKYHALVASDRAAVEELHRVNAGTLRAIEFPEDSQVEKSTPSQAMTADVKLFAAYMIALLRRAEKLPSLPTNRYSALELATAWVKDSVRKIGLHEDHDGLLRHELERKGLARSFLDAAYSGPDQVARRCVALSVDLPQSIKTNLSDRMFDVVSTTILRAKPVLCPFTGERGLAYDNIDLQVYLYRPEHRICLMIAGESLAHASSEYAWFFPDDDLFLVSVNWESNDKTLIYALARAFDNRAQMAKYLNFSSRPIMVSDIAVGHLGHYIWNEISGWPALLEHTSPGSIDIISTNQAAQIFGGVKELYPELVNQSGQLFEAQNYNELYQTMLGQKALALLVMDRYVRQDLAERVIGWCRNHCSPAFLAKVAGLKRDRRPLLLITLRLDNREWVEQETGLPKIINELTADFPQLAVVLDGLNSSIVHVSSHAFMSLDAEQALARRIIASCPGAHIENSIGCTPAESIIWADTVDAFLAPVGAGMAKYRWITNKPGVAFSNQTCLNPGNIDGHLYEFHRESLVPMYFVDHGDVHDVGDERHGEKFRANFSMSWEAPYHKITELLARLSANNAF